MGPTAKEIRKTPPRTLLLELIQKLGGRCELGGVPVGLERYGVLLQFGVLEAELVHLGIVVAFEFCPDLPQPRCGNG